MLDASATDPECCPNTITYSSLITACERGGRLDRALDWYRQMRRNGVDADYIIYRCAPPLLAPGCGAALFLLCAWLLSSVRQHACKVQRAWHFDGLIPGGLWCVLKYPAPKRTLAG